MNQAWDTFDFHPRTRVLRGPNILERVGALARELNAGNRILLVTDPGLVQAGHAGRVRSLLEGAGLQVTAFERVRENPTTRDVAACLECAKTAQVELIVGLGGGSSIDTAKGCNFLLTNGGRMQDYHGSGKASRPMLPLIAIPTTAGTGSECQSFALIADEENHQKMACGDPKAAARLALLDPALTLSQPPRTTACTGIDALAHALESAVTRVRNPVSALFAREAWVLANAALPEVLAAPANLDARARMQWAAALSGMAIEHSMLGAAHAAANPLTAHFGTVHGQAVGMLLPFVIRYNARDPQACAIYRDLAWSAGLAQPETPPQEAAEALVRRILALLDQAGLPPSLSDLGVSTPDLPALAQEAARQWTAGFNPRPLEAQDFQTLYLQALGLEGARGRGSANR